MWYSVLYSRFVSYSFIILQPSRTHVTALQFEQDGDVVTADSDGFITVYSVDSDGAYFVRMEFEVRVRIILHHWARNFMVCPSVFVGFNLNFTKL